MDWLDLLAVQGTLKSLLQQHSSNASILRRSAFFTVQLSHPYILFNHSVVSESFVTPWNVARQAPRSIGFLRQEYWSGLPFFSPGGLTDPGIKLTSSAWQAGSLPMSHQKVNVKVAQSCPTLSDPMDPMEFSMPEYWSG